MSDPTITPSSQRRVLTTRFINLLEAVVADPKYRHITGILRNSEEILRPEVLALLEESHDGVFAFLAFDPRHDRGFSDYVRSGALARDTGRHVMALYAVEPEPPGASTASMALDLNAILDRSVDPASEMVRDLFPKQAVQFPGILVIPRFSRPDQAVYVPAADGDERRAAGLCRTVFAAMAATYQHGKAHPGSRFTQELMTRLSHAQVACLRTQRRSFFRWLADTYVVLRRRGADLGASAGLLA